MDFLCWREGPFEQFLHRGNPIHSTNQPTNQPQGFPLYEAHQIGRATTGEPTPLSRGGLVIALLYCIIKMVGVSVELLYCTVLHCTVFVITVAY